MTVNVLISYCVNKNIFSDFDTLPLDSLCEHFKTVYASARNQKGGVYSKNSMINLRCRIQRLFLKIRDTDIVNNNTVSKSLVSRNEGETETSRNWV